MAGKVIRAWWNWLGNARQVERLYDQHRFEKAIGRSVMKASRAIHSALKVSPHGR